MEKKQEEIKILEPATLRDLVLLLKEYSNAEPFAGGTHIMPRLKTGNNILASKKFVSLTNIEDFEKIRRKENNLEIGPCVPLSRILSIGSSVIPEILITALRQSASPSVRNLSTLGGNICIASPDSDSILPLILLEAKCEIRGPQSHYWIPLSRFFKEPGKTALNPGEIVSLISIPLHQWDFQVYRKTDAMTSPDLSLLKFAGAVRIYKNTITDFRIAFGGVDPLFMRSREVEAFIIGAKIPIVRKTEEQFILSIKKMIDQAGESFLPRTYHKATALRLAKFFIYSVNQYKT